MMEAIELEDLGTFRLPNQWQLARIGSISDKANRAIAPLAFGMGMSIQQFKALSPEDQARIRGAYLALTAPGNL